MIEKMKLYRRTLWGLFTAGLAFAFVTLMGQQSLSSNQITDAEKRQKIEAMYKGYKQKFPEVQDISPREAMKLAEGGKVVFIDVRQTKEQAISMLPGAIPDKEFLKNPDKYKDYVKIAYCTISYRSGKFAQKLRKDHIIVYNLQGGLLAWVHDGGKVYHNGAESKRIHVYGPKWNLGPAGYEAIW
jgi:rhodanese-related sulfurtransferase